MTEGKNKNTKPMGSGKTQVPSYGEKKVKNPNLPSVCKKEFPVNGHSGMTK